MKRKFHWQYFVTLMEDGYLFAIISDAIVTNYSRIVLFGDSREL